VRLDVPDEVRNKVVADGNAAWLDELPSVVESVARDWSLTIGGTLRGGHAALVVEASLADGTAAVLKVGVPGTRRELGFEAAVLRVAEGDGCASLLRDDLDRDALLLERLGAALYDVVPDPASRHDMLCDVAARLWRPVGPDVDLPTGADMTERSRFGSFTEALMISPVLQRSSAASPTRSPNGTDGTVTESSTSAAPSTPPWPPNAPRTAQTRRCRPPAT
jgi:hypothetical protein